MFKKLKMNVEEWVQSHRKSFPRNGRKVEQCITCGRCSTFYYKKAWHFEKSEDEDARSEEKSAILSELCPACLEEENAVYDMESRLIVSGWIE